MTRSAEANAREAKIAELKQLITAGRYETIEMLEDAVDRLLWSEQDRLQQKQQEEIAVEPDDETVDDLTEDEADDNDSTDDDSRDIVRSHPK